MWFQLPDPFRPQRWSLCGTREDPQLRCPGSFLAEISVIHFALKPWLMVGTELGEGFRKGPWWGPLTDEAYEAWYKVAEAAERDWVADYYAHHQGLPGASHRRDLRAMANLCAQECASEHHPLAPCAICNAEWHKGVKHPKGGSTSATFFGWYVYLCRHDFDSVNSDGISSSFEPASASS